MQKAEFLLGTPQRARRHFQHAVSGMTSIRIYVQVRRRAKLLVNVFRFWSQRIVCWTVCNVYHTLPAMSSHLVLLNNSSEKRRSARRDKKKYCVGIWETGFIIWTTSIGNEVIQLEPSPFLYYAKGLFGKTQRTPASVLPEAYISSHELTLWE
jgi:hypothetical protein